MNDHKPYCMMHPDNEQFRNCFSACNCDEKTLAYIATHPAVVEMAAQLAAVTADLELARGDIDELRQMARVSCGEEQFGADPGNPALRVAERIQRIVREREDLRTENARLSESIEDVERLHAEHLADCTVEDGTYDYCDEEMAESRHHAATCALAHALYILRNGREERDAKRREVLAQIGE
jgi:DNA-binding SARP family transcriptional activator